MTHDDVINDVEIVVDQPSSAVKGCASGRRPEDLGRAYLLISIIISCTLRLVWLRIWLCLMLLLLLLVVLRLGMSWLVESQVFRWRCSYIIVIIEWVEPHSTIMRIIILLLHGP